MGATSGCDGNIGGIVRGGGVIEANLVPKSISIDRGSSGEVIARNIVSALLYMSEFVRNIVSALL